MRFLAAALVLFAACSTGKPDRQSTPVANAPDQVATAPEPDNVCGRGGEPSHAPESDTADAMQDCSYEVDIAASGTTVACCYKQKADACAQLGCAMESCVDDANVPFDRPRCEHGQYGVEPP